MKLPAELLRPLVEPPYIPEAGDIDIASLLKQRSEPATDHRATMHSAEICDDAFNLTAAGIRTLNVLKSMKDENRKKILSFTSRQEKSVTSIADHLHASQPAVSHHLALLFNQGLLRKERSGKNNLYSVSEECRSAVRSLCQSLQRLKGQSTIKPLEGERCADAFSTLIELLSDGMRLRIMYILQSNDETSVNHLCDVLHTAQPAVSHHLALMREAELIAFRKDGKHNYYSITEHGKAMLFNAGDMLQKLLA